MIGTAVASGSWPMWLNSCGRSAHALGVIAATIATTRNTSVSPTLKNCARSSVLYTTGDIVSAKPMAIITPTVM